MKTFKQLFFPHLEANKEYFRNKSIIDFPAGAGETSRFLNELNVGATIHPFDLFPEFFKLTELTCRKLQAGQPFPLADQSIDAVICQEGIEHFSDQLGALKEFSRVMKKGGKLFVTTPNYSNLTYRLSYFLTESERYHRFMPPNEVDSVWLNHQKEDQEVYLGHVFLLGIQKLRLMAKLAGFRIEKMYFSDFKPTAFFWFVVFYPFILIANLITVVKAISKKPQARSIYWEVFRLAIDPRILTDGCLIVQFEKELEIKDVPSKLRRVGDFKDNT